MYKTCIQKNAQLGLPLETCDEALSLRKCLYVDGAQWKLVGTEGMSYFQNLFSYSMRNAAVLAGGIAWQILCMQGKTELKYGQEKSCKDPKGNADATGNLICHITGAALMLAEIGEFTLDMDKYSGELEGDTVC